MAHAILMNPAGPVAAVMAVRDRLPFLQQLQHAPSSSFSTPLHFSLRFQDRITEMKTVPGGSSSWATASRLLVCSASQGSATSESDGGNEGVNRKGRGNRPALVEEDIYTIDDGWKIEFDAAEEMLEVAGVQIPVRLKQQLQSQRRSKRVVDKTPAEPPRTTHKLLRVMAGRVAGKKLTSPADAKVRPMMEVVRGAVFNILQSLGGWTPSAPSGRWLDLYSGTGSVAIEALSRGCCAEAHFVEMDPWVVSNVLRPNLQDTNFHEQSVIHLFKVETLLQNVSDRGAQFLGGPFDFISVTPPYEAVSYTELMAQLSESPLLSDKTCIVVEYPLKSKHEMPDTCGPLIKFKDRRYGRTNLAMYGPTWLEGDD